MGGKHELSARQLAVAFFTGLLSLSAAAAGLDWRGALLAVPVVLIAAWCWSGLGDWAGGWGLLAGKLLGSVYLVWCVALAGAVLGSAGWRLSAPGGRDAGWVIALLWVPILFLVKGKPAAFGRAAEIFYLAMGATAVFVLLLGATQIKMERLLAPTGEVLPSLVTAAGVGCTGVAGVLLWNGQGKSRWPAWSGGSAAALALLSAVTVGVLSPAVAAGQARPFFVMTVGLGETARVEGLVSALWLLADVTLAGLLLQCGRRLWALWGWKESWGAWILAAAALAAALWAGERSVDWLTGPLPLAGLILGGGVPLLARLGRLFKKPPKNEN